MPRKIDRAKAQRELQKRLDSLGKEFGFNSDVYESAKNKVTNITGAKNIKRNAKTGRITFSLKGVKDEHLKISRNYLRKNIPSVKAQYGTIRESYRKEIERSYNQHGKKAPKKKLTPKRELLRRWSEWKDTIEKDLDYLITVYYSYFGSDSLYKILGDEWKTRERGNTGEKANKNYEQIDEAVDTLSKTLQGVADHRGKMVVGRNSEEYEKFKEQIKWL